MDEPEVALSPNRQLAFLRIQWQRSGQVQAIIATHSPILMSLPGACLLSLDGGAVTPVRWRETEHYRVTRSFLADPESAWQALFMDEDGEGEGEAQARKNVRMTAGICFRDRRNGARLAPYLTSLT